MRRPEFQGERFEKGLQLRREVLGDAYVQPSLDAADDLTAPLQKLITEWCWGEIWSRPGLERKTRSLLNLAMLTALNRGHELKLHVRGARNNGVSEEEIVEVILQAAIYCGVPAALDAMRNAREVILQMREEGTERPED